jgi:hypothetical protein
MLNIQMETNIMASTLTVSEKAKGNTFTPTEIVTKAISKTITSTVSVN